MSMYKNEANRKVVTKMRSFIYQYVITSKPDFDCLHLEPCADTKTNSTPIRNIFILSSELRSCLDQFIVSVAIKKTRLSWDMLRMPSVPIRSTESKISPSDSFSPKTTWNLGIKLCSGLKHAQRCIINVQIHFLVLVDNFLQKTRLSIGLTWQIIHSAIPLLLPYHELLQDSARKYIRWHSGLRYSILQNVVTIFVSVLDISEQLTCCISHSEFLVILEIT